MSERLEPFWAEIAADGPSDQDEMLHHLGLSALYDDPETNEERDRIEAAKSICRLKDQLGSRFRGNSLACKAAHHD